MEHICAVLYIYFPNIPPWNDLFSLLFLYSFYLLLIAFSHSNHFFVFLLCNWRESFLFLVNFPSTEKSQIIFFSIISIKREITLTWTFSDNKNEMHLKMQKKTEKICATKVRKAKPIFLGCMVKFEKCHRDFYVPGIFFIQFVKDTLLWNIMFSWKYHVFDNFNLLLHSHFL